MSLILGIDPGSEFSAWCQLANGVPQGSGKVGNSDLLHMLRRRAIKADLLAVEGIASYGMAVGREVFDTCLWIGRYLEAWERSGGVTKLVYRREVKLFLCESMKANDANIRAALIDIFGPGKEKAIGLKKTPGPLHGLKGDEWSALAVGFTARGVKPSTATLIAEAA